MSKTFWSKKMQMLRHAMIDLETMATTQDAAIVSIGVVIFDPRLVFTSSAVS